MNAELIIPPAPAGELPGALSGMTAVWIVPVDATNLLREGVQVEQIDGENFELFWNGHMLVVSPVNAPKHARAFDVERIVELAAKSATFAMLQDKTP